MNDLQNILKEFEYTAHHPGQMVRDWKKETGGKAVGWLPIHCPEEVIHAAGMLPVGLWGGQTRIKKASEYLQPFCCSVMKAVMEFALNGVYRDLEAIVSPNTCDTLRCIPLMLTLNVPHPPVIGLVLPDNRKIECGVQYTAEEYRKLASELERISGNAVTDEALEHSIEVYNQHHALMMEFFDLAASHGNVVNPYYRHMVIKSSFFVSKEKHMESLTALVEELKKLPVAETKRKRVVLTGIMEEPYELLNIIEEYGFDVVGDDLAQGSRQFRQQTPAGTDPFLRLAQRFADFEGCSCVYDDRKLRGALIQDLVKKQHADGVVVLMMKFCDPEEYDYPFLKQDLEEAGIPYVYIESEQQMESLEQARTRVQAFAEMLA